MKRYSVKKVATPRFRRTRELGQSPDHGSATFAARVVLSEMEGVWSELVNSHFYEVVEWMWNDAAIGTREIENLRNWINEPPEIRRPASVQVGLVVCAYAVEALRAESQGKSVVAWQALASANYYLGFARGVIGEDPKVALQEGRTRGTKKRSETYLRARHWVWAKWQDEKDQYGGNRASAARDYEPLIPRHFTTAGGDPLKVKRETLADTWLKKAPPKIDGGTQGDS